MRSITLLHAALLALLASAWGVEGPPGFIDYQGQLLNDAGGPLTSAGGPGSEGAATNYEVHFRIWDAQIGGALVWAEKQIVTVTEDGFFSVRLGEGEALAVADGENTPLGPGELYSAFDTKERFLGVTVLDPAVETASEIQPRLAFLSAPYALVAETARHAEFGPAGGTFSAGSIGVNTPLPMAPLHVTGTTYIEGGVGIPSAGEFGSEGSRLVLEPGSIGDNAATPYGFGVTLDSLWAGVPSDASHRWYTGTTETMSLGSAGGLTLAGGLQIGSGNVISSESVVEVESASADKGLVIHGTDPGDYLTLTQRGGESFFSDSEDADNYFLKGAGGDVAVGNNLDVPGTAKVGNLQLSADGYLDDDGNPGGNNDDWIRLSGAVEMRADNADKGIVLYATANTDSYLALTQKDGKSYFSESTDSNDPFLVGDAGNAIAPGRLAVGGGTAPLAPLHVFGSTQSTFFWHWSLETYGNVDRNGNKGNLDHSIISEARVRATGFDLVSDARIKNVLQLSDSAADLETLSEIEITDYTYKDATKGGAQKKVIAQQVERVFPQAVVQSTGVVPDIYQKAEIADGWIQLETSLTTGEHVQLMTKEATGVHEVLAVKAGAFRTTLTDDEKVFVYGRQVEDFRSVDYDAIAMLNVSATQGLKEEKDAEVNALRVENEVLRAALSSLQESVDKRLAEFESRDKKREAQLSALIDTLSDSRSFAVPTVAK